MRKSSFARRTKEFEFPFVGIHKDSPRDRPYLVLFYSDGCGTHLATGQHYTTRNMKSYDPYEGEIALRNDPRN